MRAQEAIGQVRWTFPADWGTNTLIDPAIAGLDSYPNGTYAF
jgi:hypothetical protein